MPGGPNASVGHPRPRRRRHRCAAPVPGCRASPVCYPPPGLKVLLTRRTHPGLPADVDANHPVRGTHVDHLTVSSHATAEIDSVRLELNDLFGQRESGSIMAGMFAAARGGFVDDLVELAGCSK